MNKPKALFYFIIVVILISACCPRKQKLSYAVTHCDNIDYYSEIELIESSDICIKKVEINTYTKAGQLTKHYYLEDNYSNWCDSTCISRKYLCFPETLPTKYDWEVIINDSLYYNITNFVLGVSGGMTTFCECYGCGIASYKVNGNLIELINPNKGSRSSMVYLLCKEHLQ